MPLRRCRSPRPASCWPSWLGAVGTKRIQRGAEADGRAVATVIESAARAILAREVTPLPVDWPTPDKFYIIIDGAGMPNLKAAVPPEPGRLTAPVQQRRAPDRQQVHRITESDAHPFLILRLVRGLWEHLFVTIRRSAWSWDSWKQAMIDVASGEVHEHHHLEFKRDNYGSENSSKKELAKDVAALAVDGGVLVIGVDEDNSTGRATQLAPVTLAGQVERIQNICAGRIDPPLSIKVRDLPDPDNPETGLIVIEVPSSPTAPHQVDGRYLGRADRMVRVLSDAEVVRLHQLRVPLDREVENELQSARKAALATGFGHRSMILVITPTPVIRKELLRDQLAAGNWSTWLSAITDAAAARCRNLPRESPLASLTYSDRGFPFSSRNNVHIPGGQSFRYNGSSECHLALEVYESGALALFARDVVGECPIFPGASDQEIIFDQFEAVSYAFLCLGSFAAIAEDAAFHGTAGVGLFIDGLEGSKPLRPASGRYWSSSTPYRDAEYQRVTSTTTIELASDCTRVIDQLFGPLLRSLGMGDILGARRTG